jgi:hypothetical protein
MNKLEFSEQMSRMTEAFGEKIYTASRTALIWKLVEDMEPGDFRRVVDHFIRTCRQAPLPADFDQATIPYRRKILPDTGALDPLCLRCNDVGFIRVRYHEDTEGKSATLMRCSCPNGKRHSDLFIPTWERGLEAAFAWDACPLEWFKPRNFEPSGEGVTFDSLLGILDKWKARLRAADKHWKDLSKQETGS